MCNCLIKEVMPAFFSDVCSPPSGGQGTRGEGDRGRVLWCLGELCNDWCYDKKIAGENELTCGLKIILSVSDHR